MLGKVKTLDHRLLARRCLCCGYDGVLLKGGTAERCARCNCDLKVRPARSYAEMEGLLGQPFTLDSPVDRSINHRARGRQERLIHRWLAFLFFTMIGFLALLYLTAAVFAV